MVKSGVIPTPDRRWTLYCIARANRRKSYVGVTVDLEHRLRQHNGEIKGGARATRGYTDWQVFYTITGFPGQTAALQWEKRLHLMGRGRKGQTVRCPCCRRLAALKVARAMERVTKNARPNSELRLKVHYHRHARACCHRQCGDAP